MFLSHLNYLYYLDRKVIQLNSLTTDNLGRAYALKRGLNIFSSRGQQRTINLFPSKAKIKVKIYSDNNMLSVDI